MRKPLFGVNIQVFNGLGDDRLVHLASLGQRVQGGQHRAFGIDFKESAQARTGIAAAKPIRPKRCEAPRRPPADEIGQRLEIIRCRNQHAVRIREAVSRLRAGLRKAHEDVRKANDDVDLLTSPEIAALQTRADAWLTEIRRLAHRVSRQEDAPLRGLVIYAIRHLQEIADALAAN